MTPRAPSLPLLIAAFAAYSYGATAVSAAWFLRRDHGLETLPSIGWAALMFSPWVVVGLLVWVVLHRIRAQTRSIVVLMGLAVPVVPLAGLAATFVDRAMRGADWSTPEILARTVDRLPIAILLYTALAAAGLAAAYGLRVQRQRSEIRDLNRALHAARSAQVRESRVPNAPAALMVSVGRHRVPVKISEIERLSSAGNYVVVHWRDQEGLLRETLNTLENRLGTDSFARCHRSTLINLALVAELRPLADGAWRATMDSDTELVISRTYRDALLARLGRR